MVLVLLAASSCSDDPEEATHPLLDESPGIADPTPTITSTATAPTSLPTDASFPQECGQVIRSVDVANIVAAPMPGVRRIYQNDFPADSGRLERLTCSYGTETSGDEEDGDNGGDARDQPVVEIAISSYVDAEAATARVEDTAGSARIRGEDVEETEIGGHAVFIIPGNDATSYVLGVQERTYVVTLARDVVPEPAEQVVLVSLVEEVLGLSTGS